MDTIKGYVVTGITTRGRRFKHTYSIEALGTRAAMGINLYRGSVWIEYKDGKRKLIKRVFN